MQGACLGSPFLLHAPGSLISGQNSPSAWSASRCARNWINLNAVIGQVIDGGDKSLGNHTEKAELLCVCGGQALFLEDKCL